MANEASYIIDYRSSALERAHTAILRNHVPKDTGVRNIFNVLILENSPVM